MLGLRVWDKEDVELLEQRGQKDAQRDGAPLPWKLAEGAGTREKKAPGMPHCSLLVLEGNLWSGEEPPFYTV